MDVQKVDLTWRWDESTQAFIAVLDLPLCAVRVEILDDNDYDGEVFQLDHYDPDGPPLDIDGGTHYIFGVTASVLVGETEIGYSSLWGIDVIDINAPYLRDTCAWSVIEKACASIDINSAINRLETQIRSCMGSIASLKDLQESLQ